MHAARVAPDPNFTFPCSRSLSHTAPFFPYLVSPHADSQPEIFLWTVKLLSTFSTFSSMPLQELTWCGRLSRLSFSVSIWTVSGHEGLSP